MGGDTAGGPPCIHKLELWGPTTTDRKEMGNLGLFHPYAWKLITIKPTYNWFLGPTLCFGGKVLMDHILVFACPPKKPLTFEVEKINWDWKKIVPPSLGWHKPVNSQGGLYNLIFSRRLCFFFLQDLDTHQNVFFSNVVWSCCPFFSIEKNCLSFINLDIVSKESSHIPLTKPVLLKMMSFLTSPFGGICDRCLQGGIS